MRDKMISAMLRLALCPGSYDANCEACAKCPHQEHGADCENVLRQESMKLLERVQQERGLGDETLDAAVDLVMRIAHEAIVGKFTEETVDLALKAINHDADMANARTEGTVAGRNERIEERLRKPRQGDGQPNLGGSNNAPARKSTNRSMFDLADDAR